MSILIGVPKPDTASLNHHFLAEQLREQQLKQWWVARQIGVAPLTVNRWLTGKVRRISLDNLARLAELLKCSKEELVLQDEMEVRATQVEQSQAAKLLVAPESQDMFVMAGQLETYERLIKAVMHPNLSLTSLLEIYTVLTLVTGLQGDFERSRNYARIKLDFAQRCGDADKELEARINIVTADGALGNLTASHQGLLDLFGAAESQGAQRSMILALINLIATYHLIGDMDEAIRCSLRGLRLIRRLPQEDADQAHWCAQATSYIYFSATSVALECGEIELTRALIAAQQPYADTLQMPVERDTLELIELVLASLEGGEVEEEKLQRLTSAFLQHKQFCIGGSMLPALILRRSGRLDEAAAYLTELEHNPGCQLYESMYIAAEWRRLQSIRGQKAQAGRWQAKYGRLVSDFAMAKRPSDDGALEFGSQFSMSARLSSQLAAVTRKMSSEAAAGSDPV